MVDHLLQRWVMALLHWVSPGSSFAIRSLLRQTEWNQFQSLLAAYEILFYLNYNSVLTSILFLVNQYFNE